MKMLRYCTCLPFLAALPFRAQTFQLKNPKSTPAISVMSAQLNRPVSSDAVTVDQHLVLDPASADVRERIAANYLGVGVNIWNGQPVGPVCVSSPEKPVPVPSAPGVTSPDNWSYLNDISSLDEHYHNQSLNASASVTYSAFSIGGGLQSSNSNHFRSYSRYIDVDKGVVADEYLLPKNATITKAAHDALHSRNGIKNFTQICGQRYVTAVMFGEKIEGTIDFQVVLNESTQKNSASVKAGVSGILGGSLDTTDEWTKMSQVSSERYNISGGPSQSATTDGWVKAIKAYGSGDAVANANYVILIKTAPYVGLSWEEFGSFQDLTDKAQGTVTNLVFVKGKAVQMLTDYQSALDPAAAQYFSNPPTEISEQIGTLVTYVDNLGEVYLTCGKAVTAAGITQCKTDASKYATIPTVKPLVLVKQQ